ncbi:MAG: aldo/keto reductase [Bryobacterales bacterium]|nr:aldo/keto reductase [Bryobacterales bacterium]
MNRRTFLQVSSIAAAGPLKALAEQPMPMATLGKSGLRVSRFTLGGYHMRANGEENALRIIRRALELGVNFFDSAHKYNNGESDVALGKAFQGAARQKVLLMSKAQLRDRAGAMRQIEETLQRMRTDYLDLWQCHEVTTHEEVDKIFGPNGALEAFVKAKEQGKVRHIGFTGHADPSVHQRLLDGYDGWETAQMPVNLVDKHYLSFIDSVLPNVRRKGLGVLAMKSNAMGPITRNKIATIEECLRYSLAQDVDTVVSGPETVEQLEQNILVVKTRQPMSRNEQQQVLARTHKGPFGSGIERYKRKEAGALHPVHQDGEPV